MEFDKWDFTLHNRIRGPVRNGHTDLHKPQLLNRRAVKNGHINLHEPLLLKKRQLIVDIPKFTSLVSERRGAVKPLNVNVDSPPLLHNRGSQE